MKFKVLLSLIFSLFLFQIVFSQDIPVNTVVQKGYSIGPGDEITGHVLGEKDYDFIAIVNENGVIEVPFSEQPVVVKCQSERELRTNLIKLLSRDLKRPMLNITIKKNYRTATIYGEVNKPSEVELRRKITLIELLAIAGGPKEEADGMVQIIRTQPPLCSDDSDGSNWKSSSGDPTDAPSRMFSLKSANLGTEDSNPVIYPGDVIMVQKASPVYITGEVVAPQGIYLKEGGTSLLQAIGQISGLRPEAKTKDVKIFRLRSNSKDRDTISANLDLIRKGQQKDIMLEPYDIVQVDKSKDSMAVTILKVVVGIGKQAATSVTGGLGYRIAY